MTSSLRRIDVGYSVYLTFQYLPFSMGKFYAFLYIGHNL